jgi:homoserine dehydrogenase
VTFDLVLVGFGNVARRFVSLLHEQRAELQRDYRVETRVVGIATKRHGQVYAPNGVNVQNLLRLFASRSSTTPPYVLAGFSRTSRSTVDFIRDAVRRSGAAARDGRLVVVETTTLDVTRGQPAIDHIKVALAGGAHVVTANKGPVAFAYWTLSRAARRARRQFLFEGAVMDGIPIFNLVRETLPLVKVRGFRGVVNSTTNFILTAIEQGQPYEAALAEMQERGIAEADPSLDVDGWDAAAKTAALANVLLGARLTPRTVERQGITPTIAKRAIEARSKGRRVKLVVRARRKGSQVVARVAPDELAEQDLLAGLEGQQNAIILQTDLLEEIAIVQRGGSLTQTAYALLSDLVTIARAPAPVRRPSRATR